MHSLLISLITFTPLPTNKNEVTLWGWVGQNAYVKSGLAGHIISQVDVAAAAKSLQSCPTLCDPIDGSPPGSPVPGILQARTLEWVAVSFSNK